MATDATQMTTERERKADEDIACLPTEALPDILMLVALIAVVIGLIIATAGYLIPRDYVFDPHLSARKMEALEMYYAELGHSLDMCIIVGMSFVAVGSVLTMCVFTYTIPLHDCGITKQNDDSTELISTNSDDRDYGSVTNR